VSWQREVAVWLRAQLRQGLRYARHRAGAGLHTLAGRPEQALACEARLVCEVQRARESMGVYRRVEALVQKHERLHPHRMDAQQPRTFVLFAGYSRSGHSLVGSLLDAHPQVLIAHELHALRQLARGHDFDTVLRAIKYNAHLFDHLGRAYSGYDYRVPGQYQGRYTELLVAGDKKGNGTARLLSRRPELAERLHQWVPVRWIHVIRNPYDNIAAKALRTGADLERAAARYFANAETLARLKQRRPEAVLDVYLDDLVADPRAALRALLRALGVTHIPPGYLDACAACVFDAPSRARQRVRWGSALGDEVRAGLARYPFLQRFLVEPPEEETDAAARAHALG